MTLTKLLTGGLLIGLSSTPPLAGAIGSGNLTDPAWQNAQDSGYAVQTSRGEVSLELRPVWKDSVLEVHVQANTHSVELSAIDLGTATRLFVDETEVRPSVAGALSGHHGTATVVFRLERRPARFTIELRDVPDVPLRKLTWPPGGATP